MTGYGWVHAGSPQHGQVNSHRPDHINLSWLQQSFFSCSLYQNWRCRGRGWDVANYHGRNLMSLSLVKRPAVDTKVPNFALGHFMDISIIKNSCIDYSIAGWETFSNVAWIISIFINMTCGGSRTWEFGCNRTNSSTSSLQMNYNSCNCPINF